MNISSEQLMLIFLGLVIFIAAFWLAFYIRTNKAKQENTQNEGDENSRKEAGSVSITRSKQ